MLSDGKFYTTIILLLWFCASVRGDLIVRLIYKQNHIEISELHITEMEKCYTLEEFITFDANGLKIPEKSIIYNGNPELPKYVVIFEFADMSCSKKDLLKIINFYEDTTLSMREAYPRDIPRKSTRSVKAKTRNVTAMVSYNTELPINNSNIDDQTTEPYYATKAPPAITAEYKDIYVAVNGVGYCYWTKYYTQNGRADQWWIFLTANHTIDLYSSQNCNESTVLETISQNDDESYDSGKEEVWGILWDMHVNQTALDQMDIVRSMKVYEQLFPSQQSTPWKYQKQSEFQFWYTVVMLVLFANLLIIFIIYKIREKLNPDEEINLMERGTPPNEIDVSPSASPAIADVDVVAPSIRSGAQPQMPIEPQIQQPNIPEAPAFPNPIVAVLPVPPDIQPPIDELPMLDVDAPQTSNARESQSIGRSASAMPKSIAENKSQTSTSAIDSSTKEVGSSSDDPITSQSPRDSQTKDSKQI